MKHTPGLWIWKQNRGNNKFEHCVLKEDDYRIVIADLNGSDPEEIKANAKLIATAPRMLEVLQQFIHSVEHERVIEGRVVDAVRNAEEIIKKLEE